MTDYWNSLSDALLYRGYYPEEVGAVLEYADSLPVLLPVEDVIESWEN